MVVTAAGSTSNLISFPASHLSAKKNARNLQKTHAKKRNSQQKTRIQPQPTFPIPLSLSKSTLARSAIAVFGLGFIDAGYSGDWSRIGAITPQTEELLKISAFVVVPFCVFLILSFPSESDS